VTIVGLRRVAGSAEATTPPDATRGQSAHTACWVLNDYDARGTIVRRWDRCPPDDDDFYLPSSCRNNNQPTAIYPLGTFPRGLKKVTR